MARSSLVPLWGFIILFWLIATIDAAEEYMKYKDPKQKVGVRIKDLMKRMTLAEKIGQMTQIERQNCTADIIKNNFIGSMLSGGGSVPGPEQPHKNGWR